jgi:hypothetical protein
MVFRTNLSVSRLVYHDEKDELLSLSDAQLHDELVGFHIDAAPLIAEVTERANALDQYVELVRQTNASRPPLRRRLRLLGIMGIAPLVAAAITAALLWVGVIESANAKAFAGFMILGCGAISVLALLACVHVALEAYTEETLLRARAEQTVAEAAAVARAFPLTMSFTGEEIAFQFQKVIKIDALHALYDSKRDLKRKAG